MHAKIGGSAVLLHFSPHEVDDAVRSGSVWGSCLSTESCLLVVMLFLLGPMEHGYRFSAFFSVILAKSGFFFWRFPVIPRNHAKRFWRFSIVLALLVDYYGDFCQFGAI